MKIHSDLKLIKEVDEELKIKLIDLRVSRSEFMNLRLCLNEAVHNAIKHGNKQNKDLFVYVDLKADSKSIEMVVTDQGDGFDYEDIPDPTTDENIYKTYGRGIFLIKKLMDGVEFFDGGRSIKMIKYFK